jgi:hypothetical protein
MEEKIHITETEELIEEEIPAPKEVALKTVEKDGKVSPKRFTTLLSIVLLSEPFILIPLSILVLKPFSLLVNVQHS